MRVILGKDLTYDYDNMLDMSKECVLVLDNLRSVENTGSIFRTAEGLGASRIVLVGTTPTPIDRFGRKRKDFAKVSLGTEDKLPWKYYGKVGQAIEDLEKEGFEIVALEQIKNAEKIGECKVAKKFALVVGNEVVGVSRDALDLSHRVVEIPMMGEKESLNVSVATGVALYYLLNK